MEGTGNGLKESVEAMEVDVENVRKDDAEDDDAEEDGVKEKVGESEDGKVESVFFNTTGLESQREQDAARAEIARRREGRMMAVPTADSQVRLALRQRGEPTCFFGEDAHDRRERLRSLMLEDAPGVEVEEITKPVPTPQKPVEPEEFYTEGTEMLEKARRAILLPSLRRAQKRLVEARKRQRSVEWREEGNTIYTAMQKIFPVASQVGDDRPLSTCAFSTGMNSTAGGYPSTVATGSWSGNIKIWNIPDCSLNQTLRGHTERISSVVYHPNDPNVLASGAADRSVRLWRIDADRVTTTGKKRDSFQSRELNGHVDRVAFVAFHTDGALLASASYDSTWRLWDVETGTEILLQEGHARPVSRVAFHPDGSLLASAGLDRTTIIWDMRSGRSAMTFSGHMDSIQGLDFCPDGFHLATGSADNSIKIWDLRKRRCFYTIPAHTSCVSSVRYQPERGHVLVSSSFDRTVKVWSRRGYVQVGTLTSHEDKVRC